MPLSKARDRERKKQARLESKNVQPKYIVRPEIVMLAPDIIPAITITSAKSDAWLDADGQPVYEDC